MTDRIKAATQRCKRTAMATSGKYRTSIFKSALKGAPIAVGLSLLLSAAVVAQDAAAPSSPSAKPADETKTTGSIFSPGGHDVDQPIQIASDTLQVHQEEQRAVFLGNVDAIQGDMRLKTDKLEVYYVADKGESTATTDSISRMRATGSVFVSSPKETAQGEWADYDVVSRILRVHDNVLLTRGSNVLCGQLLDMKLDSGVSELKGGCKTAGQTATRVQGVFYPSKSKDGSK